jgi:DNA-directed RNA polymerase specialized sigma24 family protein
MFGNGQQRSTALNPQYATDADFCRIFKEETGSLYLLAYLLTTNHASAEQCFIASVEDAFKEDAVFKKWALTWSKRTVIKNAIKISSSESAYRNLERTNLREVPHDDPRVSALITAVNRLTALERFVFVLSALEGYPDRECSILLGCTTEDVVRARVRALQLLQAPDSKPNKITELSALLQAVLSEQSSRILLSLNS